MRTPFDKQYDEIIGIRQWVLLQFIYSLPLINVLAFGIWAFHPESSKTKANFCKVAFVFSMLYSLLFISFVSSYTLIAH